MGKCARAGTLGLCMLVGGAMGHMNSEVNLVRNRRLQEDSSGSSRSEEESVNARWQCEANEVIKPAHGRRESTSANRRCVRFGNSVGRGPRPLIAHRGYGKGGCLEKICCGYITNDLCWKSSGQNDCVRV